MTDQTQTGRTASAMMYTLHWVYERAIAVLPGLGSAEDLAKSHLARCDGAAERAINDLITWQVGFAGAAGFVTNLGGFATMPVTVPANLASVLLIQLRMIAAIAILRGYQVSDPRVRTLAFLCLLGSGAADVLEELSVGLGTRLSTRMIMRLSGGTLSRINQAAGFKLVTNAGATGLVNLTRIVPVVGGLVGGGFDALVTRGIGTAAKMTFKAIQIDASDDAPAASSTTPPRTLGLGRSSTPD